MTARTNKTDSPSIAEVNTYPEYIREVRTMPGTLQSEHRIVTEIVLAGDYFTGQQLDEQGRRVLRLERIMLESEAYRICHVGYDDCVECGASTKPEPERTSDMVKHYQRKQRDLDEQLDRALAQRRNAAVAAAQEILDKHDSDGMMALAMNSHDFIPLNHIQSTLETLRNQSLDRDQLIKELGSAEHWLKVARKYEESNRPSRTEA